MAAIVSRRFSPQLQEMFLEILREGGTPGYAAKRINVSLRLIYHHRSRSDEFRENWDLAVEQGTDLLENEAVRRAYEGWEEDVYQQGARVGSIRKFSDNLLMFLLRARRPARFREQTSVEDYVRRMARKMGVDEDAALAEAESILARNRHNSTTNPFGAESPPSG